MNLTRDTVTLASGYGCAFFLHVFRGTEQVAMEGADYFCVAAGRLFPVAPGDSLVVKVPLQAMLQENAPVSEDREGGPFRACLGAWPEQIPRPKQQGVRSLRDPFA